jgi:antitoxin (DNA-binding transcriptional repressor) of toxin-antitoxin stability system
MQAHCVATPQLPIRRDQPRVACIGGRALALGGSGVWRDGVAWWWFVSVSPRAGSQAIGTSSFRRNQLQGTHDVIYANIMNTATTADLRNHFRRISSYLDNGESVEILKRGKPYAVLLPIAKTTPPPSPCRVDFRAQCQAIWRGRKFSAAEVAEMLAAEREGEE